MLSLQELLLKTREQARRMRHDIAKNKKVSTATKSAVVMLEARVERMERYSRKPNLIFKGFPKRATHSDQTHEEEKEHLKDLLKRGSFPSNLILPVSNVATSAATTTKQN